MAGKPDLYSDMKSLTSHLCFNSAMSSKTNARNLGCKVPKGTVHQCGKGQHKEEGSLQKRLYLHPFKLLMNLSPT